MLTSRLCKACEEGNLAEVEEVLSSGASPNFASCGVGYQYPLHYAATRGHAHIVEVLLQNDAAVDPVESSNAWTPLMLAALKSSGSPRHVAVMTALLDAGADVEVTDAKGNTVLHILASLGQTKMIMRLLKRYPSLDVLGPGFGYLTPLHYAAEAGHADTVKFLLQQGADPRCVDATGWTPVHWACRSGRKTVLDILLAWGGSVEDRDFRSLTPLDVASLFGHVALAKLLDAQMPERCGAPLSPSSDDPVEEESCRGSKSSAADNSPPEDMHNTPESSAVIEPVTDSALFVWDRRAFFCLALGLCIVAISVVDYVSRISMATFIATSTRSLGNVEPTFLAAAILTSASAVLPSIAFGVCCGSHLRSTGSWAWMRAAAFVHLFADSKARPRERSFLFSDVFALALLDRASRWSLSCGKSAAVRRAAATCLLPPVAVACFLLLCLQVTVVAALSSLAVVAMWGCSALGFVVFKAFFMHRKTVLFLLDCLTHGSALQLPRQHCETSAGCSLRILVSSAEAQEKSAPDGGTHNCQEGSEVLHLSGAVAPPSQLQEGLCAAGGEKADCASGRIESDKASCPGNRFNSLKGTGVGSLHPESPGHERNHIRGESHQLSCSQRPNALGRERSRPLGGIGGHVSKIPFYTNATLCGSVPRRLHPCPALKGAVRLHRQHLKTCRERYCIAPNGGRQVEHSTNTCPLSESGDSNAPEALESTSEWQNTHFSAGGRRLYGSSGGLLADSLKGFRTAQESPPVADDGASQKYGASGLEAESAGIPCAAEISPRELPRNHSSERCTGGAGLLALAYAASFHRAELAKDAVTEADGPTSEQPDRAYSAVQEVGISNRSDTVIPRTESVAPQIAGVSPYGCMRHQPKQHQVADPPSCPPASPSHKSQATRFSRPGIPSLKLGGKSWLHSRLDSFRQQTLRPNPGCQQAGGTQQVLKLFFTAPAVRDAGADSKEDQLVVKGSQPHLAARFLKRKKQRPTPAQLNDSEFEDLVLQREQRIFDWYEDLVAFRYAEVTCTREATKTPDGQKPEGLAEACDHSDPQIDVNPLPLSEEECGIKWSTFESLFLQDSQDSCVVPMDVRAVPSTAKAVKLNEPHKVTCMQTEDLFELDLPERTPYRSVVRVRGKREEAQPAKALARDTRRKDFADCPSSPRSDDCGEGDGAAHACSSEGGSELIQPIIHYRFKDMVEMPHLREVFFTFWCREFEKLILYQDKCFGDNPFWIPNALEEDSVSAFSQACLSSSTYRTPRASARRSLSHERGESPLGHSRGRGTEVLWLVPQHTSEVQQACSTQLADDGATNREEKSDRPHGLLKDLSCRKPSEPPMMYAVAVSLVKPETRKRLALTCHKQRRLWGNPVHGSAKEDKPALERSTTVSDIASYHENTGQTTLALKTESSRAYRGGLIPVAEACQFVFVLALTLDLLLGLFPLLIALLPLYLLPQQPYSGSAGPCHEVAMGPAAVPGGYLLSSSRPTTATDALCALHVANVWSIVLALVVSSIYATLLFCRAVHLFFPVKSRVYTF